MPTGAPTDEPQPAPSGVPSPSADRDAAALATLILSLARKVRAGGFEHPDIVDLSPVEASVITRIHQVPGISPGRLCQDLGLRTSNTSAALRDLEKRGFITREPDPQDRRSVRVMPTAAAERSTALVRQGIAGVLAPALAELLDNGAGETEGFGSSVGAGAADVAATLRVLERLDGAIGYP